MGLALYALVTLATVNKPFNPIFGATLAFLLTVVALYLLIVLLYTTINQMRPVQIVEAIHDHVFTARGRQMNLIRKTRRISFCGGPTAAQVRADEEGFVTRIDVDAIGKAVRSRPGEVEIALHVAVGSYVVFQDVIATVKTKADYGMAGLVRIIRAAVFLERQPDITADAGYGVEQLAMIGWTSVSSAKSNLAPGLLVLHALRDVLAHWSAKSSQVENGGEQDLTPWPIVYKDDAFERLLDAFESLAVISSESMQYQIFAEVLRTFAAMYSRVPAEHQPRIEDLLCRILSAMDDHVLTRELDTALSAVVQTMTACNRVETASVYSKGAKAASTIR